MIGRVIHIRAFNDSESQSPLKSFFVVSNSKIDAAGWSLLSQNPTVIAKREDVAEILQLVLDTDKDTESPFSLRLCEGVSFVVFVRVARG